MHNNASYQPIELWGGIECTINRVHDQYFDQLDYSGHYGRDSDIDLIAGLGIKKIRYPLLWEKHQPREGQGIDWSHSARRLEALRVRGIDVIAGLLHHGSGPSYTDMLDPAFPEKLAAYAAEAARAFPWIRYYTPVNEPLTTARFSGLYGLWYPHKKDDRSFLRMLINELKGTVLAMQAIRKINPEAELVQTEDLGKTYSTKKLQYQARFENERRWLTYDFLTGRVDEQHYLWTYLRRMNIPEKDLQFFLENPFPPRFAGFNHYVTSERFLDERTHLYPPHTIGGNGRHRYADVEAVRVELEVESGVARLLREAWDRFGLPMAVTEVHLHCHREEQLRWFRHVWDACNTLKAQGVDLQAVTAWALLGSYGWNRLLTRPGGDYEPGAFDLRSGQPRPTALASFIRDAACQPEFTHHLADSEGWWLREDRYLNPPLALPVTTDIPEVKSRPLLILGKNGTLGRAFARICERRCIPFVVAGREDCDITNLAVIEQVLEEVRPWAVINTAGYVRIDDAQSETEKCYRENALGPQLLSIACRKRNIRLVTFSTDQVFDGRKGAPYIETDAVNPLNVYGSSKAEGEQLVLTGNPETLVIRTSAFFGPWDPYNFVYNVLDNLSRQEPVTAANDIYISPTYVPDLVHTALDLLIDGERGLWHLSNQGIITWADLAYETARKGGFRTGLIDALPRKDIPYPAPRPAYSVLGSVKGALLPRLDDALERFFAEQKAFVNL
ncbi:MAG TPA: family 1 glycosylhydrolase [Chitinophagaceae bacterium]|jgi:dTDP-4-dehydrorhamnose reductase|nr:family 1 glycosylhydrolase [Chitinophagaceae bacterium]